MHKNYSFWSREYVKLPILFKFEIDDKGNRCGYINKDEAIAHGFTEKQWDKFYKRCKAYMQDFLRKGYCEAFPINVIYCKETDKYYLADGQGRVGGMKLIIMCGKEVPFETVPVQMFTTDSFETVHEFIREINTKKMVNMSSSDMNDIDAKVCGGEVAEVRAEVINYRDNIVKVKADYIPEFMFFGANCSHTKHNPDHHYTRESFRKYHETYCEQYAYFINNVAKTAIEIGVISEERANILIRKQALGILMGSYFKLIETISEKFNLNVEERITEATMRIVKYWNDKRHLSGSNFKEAMNTDKGAKEEFAKAFNLDHITTEVFNDIMKVYGHDISIYFLAFTAHSFDKKAMKLAV